MDLVCLEEGQQIDNIEDLNKKLKGSFRSIANGGERSLTIGAPKNKCSKACHKIDFNLRNECYYGYSCKVCVHHSGPENLKKSSQKTREIKISQKKFS